MSATTGLHFNLIVMLLISAARGLIFIIMLVVFQISSARGLPIITTLISNYILNFLRKIYKYLNKRSVGDLLLYLLLSESGSPPPRRGELRLASLFRRLEVEASKLTTVSFFQPPLVFRPPFFPIQIKSRFDFALFFFFQNQ